MKRTEEEMDLMEYERKYQETDRYDRLGYDWFGTRESDMELANIILTKGVIGGIRLG